MSLKIAISALAVVIVGTACKASFPTEPTAPAPLVALHVVWVSPFGTVGPGSNAPLLAVVQDSDYGYRDVTAMATWSSLNPLVADVAPNGVLVARAPGVVEVTARFEGVTGLAVVRVEHPMSRPLLQITFASLFAPRQLGESTPLRAEIIDVRNVATDVTARTSWSTSDSRIIRIAQGRLEAVGVGTAVITAVTEEYSAAYYIGIQPRFSF